jgi:hypothetical protein
MPEPTDVPSVVYFDPDDAPPPLPVVMDDRPSFMTRSAPLIDSLPERWISYLANTIAQAEDRQQHPITKAEIGMFVEICATYQLDPFAREAWLAKSKSGKLLVMVGRDGLRKIAQRNGLHIDGDVVRENDDFQLVRSADGNRTITHSYGSPKDRGGIMGAWAEAREGGPLGRPMGYFYAPLSEYKPSNASAYSPWSKQTGVMILAAAERQAIRQATPLAGLVAVGEQESAFAPSREGDITDVDGSAESVDVVLPTAVEAIVARAHELGHAGLANRSAVVMAVDGQPEAFVEAWCRDATRTLNRLAAGKPEEHAEHIGTAVDDAPTIRPNDEPTVEPFVVKITAEIAEAMGEHGQSTLNV